MIISRRHMLGSFGAAAALPALCGSAFADDYPSRPVRLVVGFTPGSASDVIGRFFAKGAAAPLGQQVVVENKPGAGSTIAANYASRAAPDGYTLFLVATSTLTNQIINKRAKLDLLAEFAPVARLASGPYVLVVNPKSGLNSVGELIASAKADPQKMLFGSVGGGSLPDLCAELFAQRVGIKLVQVPYQGSPQVISELVAGRITMAFENAIAVAGQVSAGSIRALAVTAGKRVHVLPDVPTMAEAGIDNFEVSLWIGVLAPKGTPAGVIEKVAEAGAAAMRDPQIVETMAKQGFDPAEAGPQAFERFMRDELVRWTDVARTAGLVKA